jgi:hypothetical protein
LACYAEQSGKTFTDITRWIANPATMSLPLCQRNSDLDRFLAGQRLFAARAPYDIVQILDPASLLSFGVLPEIERLRWECESGAICRDNLHTA